MSSRAVTNFMRQQGFAEEPPEACRAHFYGLYFQPRIVFPTVLLAIVLQSGWLHLALNPFELAYNRWRARPRGQAPLPPAPGPRRMAQGMAATFNLVAGLGLLYGQTVVAWVAEVFLVVGFSALLFGKLCIGAWLFHLLKGRLAFANATLPWGKGE
jgi:hypothetical protein